MKYTNKELQRFETLENVSGNVTLQAALCDK